MSVVVRSRLTLITETAAMFGIEPERAGLLVDAFFVLLADAVRAGTLPEKPPAPTILPDDERRAALIRRMDEQKRGVEDG